MSPSSAVELYVAQRTRGVILAVVPWLAGLLGAAAAVYVVAPPRQPWAGFALALGVAAGALIAMRPLVRRAPAAHFEAVACLAVLVGQLPGLGILAVTGDPEQTVVLVMSLLGASCCAPSVRGSIGVSAVALAVWSALARHYPPIEQLHWGFNLFWTATLAAIMTSARVGALRAQAGVEAELRRATDEARAATRVKSEFLATMSHELRTPLHGIFGMTELARDAGDETERRECLDRVRACARTLLGMVDDILDMSRLEAGVMALARSHFAPAAVIDAVVAGLAPEAARKGLTLAGRVADDVPAWVVGDPSRLRQILANLAANAIKFTESGTVTVRLERVADPTPDGMVTLRGVVEDTGIGIPPERQAAIFELFRQGDGSPTRRHGGTGLGLTIVRRLTALMGGTVAVDSTPGVGSRFVFTVRLDDAASDAAIDAVAIPQRGDPRGLPLPAGPAQADATPAARSTISRRRSGDTGLVR